MSDIITRESIINNSTVSGLYVKMMADQNHLNLWGDAPRGNSMAVAKIGARRWDRFEIYSSELWTEDTIAILSNRLDKRDVLVVMRVVMHVIT